MNAGLVVIDESAQIHPSVSIGPFCYIGKNVTIGANTVLASHVCIKSNTVIGANNIFYQNCVIGEAPQDKKCLGDGCRVVIGNNNVFRENTTVHRGTLISNKVTEIGDHNFFMTNSHIAHDCVLGNHIVFASAVVIGGNVVIEDYVYLGGLTAIHQFCKLGYLSFACGGSMVSKDILPFVRVAGNTARVKGLNSIGLQRHIYTANARRTLAKAYKIIFCVSKTVKEAAKMLRDLSHDSPEINKLVEFLQSSKRGIMR